MDVVVLYEIQSRMLGEGNPDGRWVILDSDKNKKDILEAWEAYGFGNPDHWEGEDVQYEHRICKVIKINEVIVGEGAE